MKQESTLTRNLAASQESAAVVNQAANAGTSNAGVLHNVVRYRLYTENTRSVIDIVSQHFDAASFYFGVGLWQGNRENSITIEIIGSDADYTRVLALAEDIKVRGRQSAVLVTRESIASVLV